VKVSVAVLVTEPDVPVTVTVTVGVGAVGLAVKVSTLEVAVELGLKDAVTPLGKPDAERATLPLNPPAGVMVMVLVPWPPCGMDTLPGEAESVKPDSPCALPDALPQPLRTNASSTTEISRSPSFSRSIRPSFLRKVHADVKPVMFSL
jgi:hypothetical protein